MPRVSLNQPAPDFSLPDFWQSGQPVGFSWPQERLFGLQPHLSLTILPQAYGAVAP
jgi:hypothetical protein